MARGEKKKRQSFGEAYQEQRDKQARLMAAPETPEARAAARKGGLLFIGLGLVFALALGIGFWMADRIFVWLAAVPIAFIGVGLWALITGKMPKGKRR